MADEIASLPGAGEFCGGICDPRLNPVFWGAEVINAHSAWCGHIPFAHWIVSTTQPRLLVELGTHTGVSYSAFCLAVERAQLATQCYAVDTWRGDAHAGYYGDEVFTGLQRYHRERFAGFSTLIRGTFDEALGHFADRSVDLLHIDGLHTYEAVYHDFNSWLSKLSSRSVVLFHDTNVRRDDFGVWRLWEELRQHYPSFEFLHGYGLGVLAVGQRPPGVVAQLCGIRDPARVALLRERFAMLGGRWEAECREQLQIERASEARAADQAKYVEHIAKHAEHIASSQDSLRRAEDIISELRTDASRSQADLKAIQEALAGAQAEALEQQGRADGIARALAEARGREMAARRQVAQLVSEADTRSRETAEARLRLEQAQSALQAALQQEVARRMAIENSTMWRALSPLRHQLDHHPGARHRVRTALGVVRSAAKPGFLQQMRRSRRTRKLSRAIADSPLFDAEWYLATYPDVAASSLEPAAHYALFGGPERRNPGPGFDAAWYLEWNPDVAQSGRNPLLHYIEDGKAEGREIRPVPGAAAEPPAMGLARPVGPGLTLKESLFHRFVTLAPLNVYSAPGGGRRLTMVTDSINAGSLFGGVGTAIVLSALLARQLGAGLRLITRLEAPDTANLATVLRTHRVAWNGDVEFLHVPYGSNTGIPIGAADIFLTTSWWTTRAVRPVIPPERTFYLLQEDERMFYPYGDNRLRCAETLADPGINFIVNSEMLFEHLVNGCEKLPNIRDRGVWFEPAFPAFGERARNGRPPGAKRVFFFYARPKNERNLYWRGLEAIGAAIDEGILDPARWEIHFAGRDLTEVELPCGIRPHLHENLPWPDYARLIGRVDVGLCLMDTPHPSYPPLDLAAAGAIAVTNRHGPKTSLSRYSKQILCVEPGIEQLKQGIAQAVALSDDPTRRETDDRINRDWETALAPVLKHVSQVAG
jgi:hypothetical protein